MNDNWIKAIDSVIVKIENEKSKITNHELIELCQTMAKSSGLATNPHFYHEIAEAALNQLIKTKYAEVLLKSEKAAESYQEILKPLVEKIPTQTWRSKNQNKWQQFSTPPGIAYLLTYLLDLKLPEKILEPSAGTGSLAVWAKGRCAKTFTNEIDEGRRSFLKILGFQPWAYNAEFINDFLPPEISPDCILMNPPFSANGGRTKNSSNYGFRHVESALERLKKGGRFGIILGEAGGLDTKTGREFWQKKVQCFRIKSNIKLSGREYYKFGTTVDINLIFGEKLIEPRQIERTKNVNQIPFFTAQSVEEAFEKIADHNLQFNE